MTLKPSIISDQSGLIVFSVRPEDNRRSYKVELETNVRHFFKTQQTKASVYIKPFKQTSSSAAAADKQLDASLWMANKRATTFQVGDRFQSEIFAERLQGNTAYLIVMSRGTVVQWKRIHVSADSKGPEIDLLISNQMVPSVRLLLVATSEGNAGELLADSHRLTITPGSSCGRLEVQLLHEKKQKKKVLPGGVVKFEVKGGEGGDVVGFHAVDEGVRLLKPLNTENASRASYSRLLERADSGCGPGGAAPNSDQVLRAADFKVLSLQDQKEVEDMDDQRFEELVCLKKKKVLVQQKRKREVVVDDSYKRKTNASTLKEGFKHWCCSLGKVKLTPSSDTSCIDQAEIIKKYTSEACADEYQYCCELVNSGKDFQGSRK